MNVLALIPARAGSKGIPHKNFRELAGRAPYLRAMDVAIACGCYTVISTDTYLGDLPAEETRQTHRLLRPPALAQDDTPMIDVVKHALSEIPGPEDQIVLLIQPTQPLRQPKHLTSAIALLESKGLDDSVVSVVACDSPDKMLRLEEGCLRDWDEWQVERRQEARSAFKADGTAYVFRRRVVRFGHIYGQHRWPLIIDPSETTPLDTPADWARAEELLRAR